MSQDRRRVPDPEACALETVRAPIYAAFARQPGSGLATAQGLLTTPAIYQKTLQETIHRLHPETAALVQSMPRLGESRLLFPWPYGHRFLFRRYHTEGGDHEPRGGDGAHADDWRPGP